VELTRLLGREVTGPDGREVGTIKDVAVRLGEGYPALTHVLVHRRGGGTWAVTWSEVRKLDEDRLELTGTPHAGQTPPDDVVWLRRDVLDCQVFDARGKRLARVADVRLEAGDGMARVVGVEVGVGAVLRRLGAGRLGRRWREDPIDWTDVHLASARGHTLALTGPTVHRLSPSDLAELLGHLPAGRGADLLEELPARVAADALSHSRPRLGARLVRAIAPGHAASIIGEMSGDDATAALRHLSPAELEALLGHVETARAAQLRQLLAHPVQTAGGLMNPDVITAPAEADVATIRQRIADHPPRLEALLTVFLIDASGRPVGTVSSTSLVTGAPAAPVPRTVTLDTPVSDVVDIFALEDVLALPVVDDTERLVGVIAVDDVLEEVLAERLPGRRRYRHGRRRRQ
jgi:sporulation protein YlmC with PRC-barrel domain